jgi:hypothetical protein
MYVLGARLRRGDWEPELQTITRFRFGGEVWLLLDVGVYLNVGELVDWVAGIFGADPARDRWYRLREYGAPIPRDEVPKEDQDRAPPSNTSEESDQGE